MSKIKQHEYFGNCITDKNFGKCVKLQITMYFFNVFQKNAVLLYRHLQQAKIFTCLGSNFQKLLALHTYMSFLGFYGRFHRNQTSIEMKVYK